MSATTRGDAGFRRRGDQGRGGAGDTALVHAHRDAEDGVAAPGSPGPAASTRAGGTAGGRGRRRGCSCQAWVLRLWVLLLPFAAYSCVRSLTLSMRMRDVAVRVEEMMSAGVLNEDSVPILMPVYGRPEYLRQVIDAVNKADGTENVCSAQEARVAVMSAHQRNPCGLVRRC